MGWEERDDDSLLHPDVKCMREVDLDNKLLQVVISTQIHQMKLYSRIALIQSLILQTDWRSILSFIFWHVLRYVETEEPWVWYLLCSDNTGSIDIWDTEWGIWRWPAFSNRKNTLFFQHDFKNTTIGYVVPEFFFTSSPFVCHFIN